MEKNSHSESRIEINSVVNYTKYYQQYKYRPGSNWLCQPFRKAFGLCSRLQAQYETVMGCFAVKANIILEGVNEIVLKMHKVL